MGVTFQINHVLMSNKTSFLGLFLFLLILSIPAMGQDVVSFHDFEKTLSPTTASSTPGAPSLPESFPLASASAKKALALSFLLPGLGHKYANQGHWNGWAVTYAAADVALWLSLFGSEWHRNSLVNSYTTLATGSAHANVEGKNRTFFLNLAAFESSEVFRETMLRNRQWDQIDYVADPSFQWEWESEASFNEFRELRNDAESLRRRRTIIIASLIVNRLLSGATSARKVSRTGRLSLAASLAPPIDTLPVFSLRVGF